MKLLTTSTEPNSNNVLWTSRFAGPSLLQARGAGNSEEGLAVREHMQDLIDMLSVRRPAYSKAQYEWLKEWIIPLPGAEMDVYDNVVVRVGDSRTIFSCHTDTVHRDDGPQDIHMYGDFLFASDLTGQASILGADDTAGAWLMRRMVLADVPGTYIFHQGEECGCVGSSYLVKENEEWLSEYDRVIAFDRAGIHDVINSQYGGECCSNYFANALSDALNEYGFSYSPESGVYTDSAEYMGVVPECTNISVGYYSQHTTWERLSILHLAKLYLACIRIDWESLPTLRIPLKEARWSWSDDAYYERNDLAKYASYGARELDEVYDRRAARKEADNWWYSLDKMVDSFDELVDMVAANPETAAMLIVDALGLKL